MSNGNNGNIYVPAGGSAAVLNAVGFNYADGGFIWAQYNNSTQLIRVGTEFVGKAYDYTLPSGFTQKTFTVGDVDVTGKMYMTRGGSNEGNTNANTDVYIVDLMQATTPFAASVVSFPNRSYITDWAFSPKDTCLYAINTYFNNTNATFANNENNTKIYRFVTHDRTFNKVRTLKGTRQTLGVATGGSTAISPANFAAAFMDSNGSFYVVSSNTGQIHRIDQLNQLPAVDDASATNTSIPATYLGTFTSGLGGNVDGVRNAFTLPTSGTLPITLAAFTAAPAPNRAVRLDWTTGSELNNSYFEVQRSADGRTFEALGRVAGHGSTAQASTYGFTDATPGPGATPYYRLRQVDLDGTSTYSPVRAVTLAAGSSAMLLSVAPNPTTAADLRVLVQYGGAEAAPAQLTVRNLLGESILRSDVVLTPGANTLACGTAVLPPGVYLVEVSGAVGPASSVRVLITN